MDTKARKPIIAALLSLFFVGLGQIYNGQIKKAIIFYLINFLLPILLFFTQLKNHFYGLIFISGIIPIVFHLSNAIEALITSTKLKNITLKKYNKWYIYVSYLILVSLLGVSLYSSDFFRKEVIGLKPYVIPSESMSPTLNRNDRIIADLKYYKTNRPQRGDVIVFDYPFDPQRQFVKRIIATEGDSIESKDDDIFVNDSAITELYPLQGNNVKMSIGSKLIVPPDKVFVIGDNVDNSEDSRVFGYIDNKNIRGKVLYIYSSYETSRINMVVK